MREVARTLCLAAFLMVNEKTEDSPLDVHTEVSDDFLEDAAHAASTEETPAAEEKAPEAPEAKPAEAPAAEAAPAETPIATSTEATPTPAVPVAPGAPTPVSDSQQARITQLEAENQRFQQVQLEAQIDQARLQQQSTLEQQGHLPESAALIAQSQADAQKSVIQYKQQLDSQYAEQGAKLKAAAMIAKQFGVEADALMPFSTPEAMQAAARDKQELAGMRTRLSKLEQGQVPSQKFQSPSPSAAASSREKKMADYASGKEFTPEEEAALFNGSHS